MTARLRQLGYGYEKAKFEPGKHPVPEVQEIFVEKHENNTKSKGEGDVVLFMDPTHPQRKRAIRGGWIKHRKST